MNHFTLKKPTGKALLLLAFLMSGLSVFAQVTTSTVSGTVSDKSGTPLIGATVVATHVPSGTRYGTATNASGRYVLPAVRVGGPFSIAVSYTGYEPSTRDGIYTSLGTAANIDFSLEEAGTTLGEVTVVATRSDIFSNDRTGAATTFARNQLASIPTVGSRTINSITKYNPNGNGNSFGAQDSRLNNFTIDGSQFNNGFGLGSDAQAGGRTGSTAISLDAIEELQVNVAPFDVRQSDFVGTGMNAVTRSGTNSFMGTAFTSLRKADTTGIFNGTKIGDVKPNIGNFQEQVYGLSIGGPIIKNKLFFFVNGEIVRNTSPATTFVSAGGPLDNGGTNVTRVKYQDLLDLSNFLRDKYRYETGAFEDYDNENKSDKFLVRLDYNVNANNKLTLRYAHHNSTSDQLISNSASLGFGNRRTNNNSMAYENAGYIIGDNTRSAALELNTTVSDKVHNSFLVSYDYQNEDRQYKGAFFPTVDIKEGANTYISFGFDPFTPSNKLSYGTFQATNNVSIYRDRHTYTIGAKYEHYTSDNLFFPGANGVYIFDSLAQFYAAANNALDNPGTNTTTVPYNRFQFRYSALPGAEEPLQTLKVNRFSLYGQDEFQINKQLRFSYGIRAGVIVFEETGLSNPAVDALSYVDGEGNRGYEVKTGKLPDAKLLMEPRMGFNWDVMGKKKTQVRGGSGVFTGRPPYVWVSNTIGNNGVLTGFIDVSGNGTLPYKFTPETNVFIPATPTLPSTFDIAATDNNYRFPQVWKNNLAIDQKLPFGLIATVELMYNRNVNAINYFDANLEPATGKFSGPDNRPRFPASGVSGSSNQDKAVRINDNISRAVVMTTTNEGYYKAATLKLEYPNKKGLFGMVAHTFSQAKDLMSAGSIASGSWTSARSVNGNNSLELGFADQDAPGRTVGMLGYRLEYGGNFGGATAVTLGYVGERRGFNSSIGINTARYAYSYGGDMNGDRVSNNDLLYVPNNASELVFDPLTVNGITFSPADQAAAFEAFIEQDDYLKTRRGQYAERNGALFPVLHRFDFSVTQEFFIKVGGKRNTIQLRADILNAANLLNTEWGLGNNLVTDRPLNFSAVTADGTPKYRMATTGTGTNTKLLTSSISQSKTQFDTWAAQFGIRYIFN
jgi:Carboxypeptidase regulatory-like domain